MMYTASGEQRNSMASEGSDDVDFEQGDAVSVQSEDVDFEEQDPAMGSGTVVRMANTGTAPGVGAAKAQVDLQHQRMFLLPLQEELEEAQEIRRQREKEVTELVKKIEDARAVMVEAARKHIKKRTDHHARMAELEEKHARINEQQRVIVNGDWLQGSDAHAHAEPATAEGEQEMLAAAIRASIQKSSHLNTSPPPPSSSSSLPPHAAAAESSSAAAAHHPHHHPPPSHHHHHQQQQHQQQQPPQPQAEEGVRLPSQHSVIRAFQQAGVTETLDTASAPAPPPRSQPPPPGSVPTSSLRSPALQPPPRAGLATPSRVLLPSGGGGGRGGREGEGERGPDVEIQPRRALGRELEAADRGLDDPSEGEGHVEPASGLLPDSDLLRRIDFLLTAGVEGEEEVLDELMQHQLGEAPPALHQSLRQRLSELYRERISSPGRASVSAAAATSNRRIDPPRPSRPIPDLPRPPRPIPPASSSSDFRPTSWRPNPSSETRTVVVSTPRSKIRVIVGAEETWGDLVRRVHAEVQHVERFELHSQHWPADFRPSAHMRMAGLPNFFVEREYQLVASISEVRT